MKEPDTRTDRIAARAEARATRALDRFATFHELAAKAGPDLAGSDGFRTLMARSGATLERALIASGRPPEEAAEVVSRQLALGAAFTRPSGHA